MISLVSPCTCCQGGFHSLRQLSRKVHDIPAAKLYSQDHSDLPERSPITHEPETCHFTTSKSELGHQADGE